MKPTSKRIRAAARSLAEFKQLHPTPDTLPADPDEQNADRTQWAEEALTAFMTTTGTDAGDAVSDLLTDLMHWCDRHGIKFNHDLDRAQTHYRAETRGLQSSRGFVLPKITPYVQCDACHYVWAYVVSPNFCPSCCHEHFTNAYDPARDPERALAYDMVFLADNEWGNTIMREISQEWFRNHPDCNFVWVYEHAGWSLVYHRSGQIVGTANDAAIMNPNRPKPTHGSTIVYRRQRKSGSREVTSFAEYSKIESQISPTSNSDRGCASWFAG